MKMPLSLWPASAMSSIRMVLPPKPVKKAPRSSAASHAVLVTT
jgi:hypothetical protein